MGIRKHGHRFEGLLAITALKSCISYTARFIHVSHRAVLHVQGFTQVFNEFPVSF